ncbi:methyltransferase [Nonomuraea sp. NPDC050310]|uniref:methyltransferase n=1 Tax=unclassified Nonomuraea TaxID=2593643 RepID=UPI00340937D8
MTDSMPQFTGAMLDFNAPLSQARADRLVALLAARKPATVVDLGCGWGELLLRLLEAVPEAHGTGFDLRPEAVARGRANAKARGLDGRVELKEESAEGFGGTADLVLNIGAYHAYGTIDEALKEIRQRLAPGGRLVFGAEFWERPPSEERLAQMWPGTSADDCVDLPTLVDRAVAAGFRPLDIGTATRVEWEEFESGFAAEVEAWLLDNPGHPEAEATRAKLDDNRRYWLRGHRDLMGFAYLVLG